MRPGCPVRGYHAGMSGYRASLFTQLAALVGGLALGVLLLMALEAWIAGIVPRPPAPDPSRPAAVAAWIAGWPTGVQMLWALGWLLAGAAGGILAAGGSGRVSMAWVCGALLTIAAILDITLVSHPVWLSWTLVIAPLAGSWLGSGVLWMRPEPARPDLPG